MLSESVQTVTRQKEGRSYDVKFQESWLVYFKWLVYSPSAKGGYCKYCVLFFAKDNSTRTKPGVLVATPFTNFRKATGKDGILTSHEKLQYHKDAMMAGSEFKGCLNNPEQTVPFMMSASNQSQYEINIHILRSIVDTVLLCGKQNISLRGHRDTFSDNTLTVSNKGNFLAILQLMASKDSLLQTHLNSCHRNASYTSKTIQNEIIDIIGDQIRSSMTECLNQEDAFFAIIADEVTDVHANQEVLSLCLRFLHNLNPEQPEVKEVFFDFVYLDKTDGESISRAIIECLSKRGIRALAPRALYVHCNSHVLNLSIASSCQIQAIKNMIDTINETFKFFHFSPKRQRFFESILDKESESHAVKKLKGLCKTRWVERHTCYETFYSLYPSVCLCLEEMLHPSQENARWNWDRETLVKAQGLLSTLTTFQYIISFIIAKNTLHTVKGIAAKPQKNGRDIYEAYQMIDDVRSILKERRTDVDEEFQDWFKEAKQIANKVGADIKVPRYAHRQQHRANAPADTPLQYFKLNVGIPFLDHIDQEMSSRFCEENRPGRDLFLLVPSVVRKCSDLHSMNNKLQFWKDDIPISLSLPNEIRLLYTHECKDCK